MIVMMIVFTIMIVMMIVFMMMIVMIMTIATVMQRSKVQPEYSFDNLCLCMWCK